MLACLPLSNSPRVQSAGNEGAHFLREVAEELAIEARAFLWFFQV